MYVHGAADLAKDCTQIGQSAHFVQALFSGLAKLRFLVSAEEMWLIT